MESTTSVPTSGTVRMHHGTNERFERFSLNFASRPGMSGNGHLGVWMATRRELAERFGKVCLDVDVQVDQPYTMPLQELSRLNDKVRRLTWDMTEDDAAATERSFYSAYRVELLVQGYDIIYLAEADGRIEMAIGLVLNKLSIQ